MVVEKPAKEYPVILMVASALTIAYLIFLTYLLAPDWSVQGIIPAIQAKDSNEIGDLLAGASAPLAFLWLVAAVLIQSQELRAQRQELVATRAEFELTREVNSKNVALVARQVEFVRAAEARAQTHQDDLLFQAKLEAIVERFDAMFEGKLPTVHLSAQVDLPVHPVRMTSDLSVKRYLIAFQDNVSAIQRAMLEHGIDKRNIVGFNLDLHEMGVSLDDLEEALALELSISNAMGTRYSGLSLEMLRDDMAALHDLHPSIPSSS